MNECRITYSFTGTLLAIWQLCQGHAEPIRFYRWGQYGPRWIG